MTTLSNDIFEKYQVRKTRRQKDDFIDFLKTKFPDLYLQEGGMGGNRNIILGNPSRAKILLTAHYDTSTSLPFPNFITPRNPLLYLLYNILILIPIFTIMIACSAFCGAQRQLVRWPTAVERR